MTVYVMWMYSLLYGLISVVQRLLENSTVLCSVSRFELLNEQAGGTGYSLSQLLLLSIINLTGFSLSLICLFTGLWSNHTVNHTPCDFQ